MAVEHVSLLSRATQGVRIMRLIEGSRVISIECTEKNQAEENAEPIETEAEEGTEAVEEETEETEE
jgi:DNA gyrase C-terminal domain, beta-propeller.